MIIAVVKELKQLQRKPRKKSEASTGFSGLSLHLRKLLHNCNSYLSFSRFVANANFAT